eukprot:2638762-Pyramimonas_sp.AAC.1
MTPAQWDGQCYYTALATEAMVARTTFTPRAKLEVGQSQRAGVTDGTRSPTAKETLYATTVVAERIPRAPCTASTAVHA